MTPTNPRDFIPDPEQAALVIVDIQERLVAAMPEKVRPKILRNAGILSKAARTFGYPTILVEQYPEGLRRTVPEVKDLIPAVKPIEKVAFNCCDVPDFNAALEKLNRRDVILCGMEAHICILQTTFGLLERGQRVFIAADAVCSRAKHNWRFALEVMRQAGAVIGTTEMLLFLMNNTAGTDRFIKLSRMVR
jgi:nicotinamidase-related amidase